MDYLLKEYRSRRSLVFKMVQSQDNSRLSDFLEWLDTHEITAAILSEIENNPKVTEAISDMSEASPEHSELAALSLTSKPEFIVFWGLQLMREIASGKSIRRILRISFDGGINPLYNDSIEDEKWWMRSWKHTSNQHLTILRRS